MSSIFDWSTTAASNSNADSAIVWSDSQAPSSVDDSGRAMMGRAAEIVKDLGGALTAGGTANALTVTANSAFTTNVNGRFLRLRIATDNTGAATLNVNAIGAKSIRKMLTSGESALTGGELQATGIYDLVYSEVLNAAAGGWLLLNPSQVVSAETRNRIVNPNMVISQENADTAATTTAYYGADQWATHFVTSAGTITSQRVQSVTPNGSKDRLRVTITAADTSLAAGEFLRMQQPIEGGRMADFRYGSASAKQSILRFGFKAPAGTYAVSLRNSATNRSYVALFTVSAANTDTEYTLVIPGDTTGTWLADEGVGVYLSITLACGSTFQGATGWQAGNFLGTSGVTNGMGTGSSVFELYDVGLYLDPLVTGLPPPWQMPDEAQELLACQRYWQSVYASAGGYVVAGVGVSFPCLLSPQMRVSPAATTTGTPTNNNVTGTAWIAVTAYSARLAAQGVAAGGFISAAFGNMNARM